MRSDGLGASPTIEEPLTDEQRAEIEERRSTLLLLLQTASEAMDLKAEYVTDLFAGYDRELFADDKKTVKAVERYLAELAEFPALCIGAATLDWSKGKFAEGNEDYGKAPTPAQLRRLSSFRVQSVRQHVANLETLLGAPVRAEERRGTAAERAAFVESVKNRHRLGRVETAVVTRT